MKEATIGLDLAKRVFQVRGADAGGRPVLRAGGSVGAKSSRCPADFVALLDDLETAFGAAGRTKPLVAVADNGPIRTSRPTAAALLAEPP